MTDSDDYDRSKWRNWPNGMHCRPSRYRGPDEDGWPRRYGDWDLDRNGPWLIPSETSGSDYSGCLVHRSNYLCFARDFSDGEGSWWTGALGGHGTFAILVDVTKAPFEAYEWLAALTDYPLADEDHHTELEMQAEDEAWSCSYGYRHDFRQALEKAGHLPEDSEETTPDATLDEWLRGALDWSAVEWLNEQGDSMYLDIDRLVAWCVKEGVLPS